MRFLFFPQDFVDKAITFWIPARPGQEGVLAIEMGAVATDLALSIHAHPALPVPWGNPQPRFWATPRTSCLASEEV
jgi:hypothetical protein